MGNHTNSDNIKKEKRRYITSIIALIVTLVIFLAVTLAWFFRQRELDTLSWIKTPMVLKILSGKEHDIAQLDMGSIDAAKGDRYYVFCVYGKPVDNYSLQLAYTTNIPFYYDVYRADDEQKGSIHLTYNDEDFYYEKSDQVIAATPLSELSDNEIKKHQRHSLSYGDEKGNNPVNDEKVQKNAEPLYWLASNSNGVSLMKPENIMTDEKGDKYFCDYYVIHVYWDAGTVSNNKETDMIYLSVGR